MSVIIPNIFMAKLEGDNVVPNKPSLYTRHLDNIFISRIKNLPNQLLEKMSRYHPIPNHVAEENPEKFLDTNIVFGHSWYTQHHDV